MEAIQVVLKATGRATYPPADGDMAAQIEGLMARVEDGPDEILRALVEAGFHRAAAPGTWWHPALGGKGTPCGWAEAAALAIARWGLSRDVPSPTPPG